MNTQRIIITGAAGFIPSCLAQYLSAQGHHLILVDKFGREDKEHNLVGIEKHTRVERDRLFQWLEDREPTIDFVFHLGARTDTTEFKKDIFDRLNVKYSQDIWMYCALEEIPLIYASSAATYGLGELGFKDDHDIINDLKPLNPYGESKNNFDKWVLSEYAEPPFWAGFKFFNVYGPNEYHKGRMASVVFHIYNQIESSKKVNLFRSHREDYRNGEQTRDFICLDDLINVLAYFHTHSDNINSGLYNLGTGISRTYNDLAKAIFTAMDLKPDIEYIDTPEDIRDKYQYFTEADMDKVKAAGYIEPFITLEDGVKKYVDNYLSKSNKAYCPE